MKKQIFLIILFIIFIPLNFIKADITIDGKGGGWDNFKNIKNLL